MSDRRLKPRAGPWICLFLAVLTFLAYFRVFHCDFLDYDDGDYVAHNAHVQAGLSWANFRWAFTTRAACNWHPLTWISHMADCSIYGLNPAGHHATNLALHILNSILLFLVLRRMTGAEWRSGFVAALFALHPLHVQSVAWIAERKDVLSTAFCLAALWAYARHVETVRAAVGNKAEAGGGKPGIGTPSAALLAPRFSLRPLFNIHYGLALFCFALALLSKPMAVTLPFLMLLLDFWPLRRTGTWEMGSAEPGRPGRIFRLPFRPSPLMLLEKVPFLVLSLGCCLATIWAQAEAEKMNNYIPLLLRLGNACEAYWGYIAKMVWPVHLAVLYPFPKTLSLWSALLAAVGLAAVSGLAVAWAARRPYFFTGWFWFLGMLVPVIGIVMVGSQSMADRYTYIPLTGLFIIIAWGGFELAQRWRVPAAAQALIALTPILACLPVTWAGVGPWQNSVALFENALQWTRHNYYMENNLGRVYLKLGNLDAAEQHLTRAMQLLPRESRFRLGLCEALMEHRKFPQAAEQLEIVLGQKTNEWGALAMLGAARVELGKPDEGLRDLEQAAQMEPTNTTIRLYDAMAQYRLGRAQASVDQYRAALELKPDWPEAMNNLAWILACNPDPGLRNGKEAVRLAEKACLLDRYRDPGLISTLAAAYAEAGRFDEAVQMANKAEEMGAAEGNWGLASRNKARAQLYAAHRPFREPGPPPAPHTVKASGQ